MHFEAHGIGNGPEALRRARPPPRVTSHIRRPSGVSAGVGPITFQSCSRSAASEIAGAASSWRMMKILHDGFHLVASAGNVARWGIVQRALQGANPRRLARGRQQSVRLGRDARCDERRESQRKDRSHSHPFHARTDRYEVAVVADVDDEFPAPVRGLMGSTRHRMYATKVAIASSKRVVRAELISPRATWKIVALTITIMIPTAAHGTSHG